LNLEKKEDRTLRRAIFYGELSSQERRSKGQDLFVGVGASREADASSIQQTLDEELEV
jgi:hypothetical protein